MSLLFYDSHHREPTTPYGMMTSASTFHHPVYSPGLGYISGGYEAVLARYLHAQHREAARQRELAAHARCIQLQAQHREQVRRKKLADRARYLQLQAQHREAARQRALQSIWYDSVHDNPINGLISALTSSPPAHITLPAPREAQSALVEGGEDDYEAALEEARDKLFGALFSSSGRKSQRTASPGRKSQRTASPGRKSQRTASPGRTCTPSHAPSSVSPLSTRGNASPATPSANDTKVPGAEMSMMERLQMRSAANDSVLYEADSEPHASKSDAGGASKANVDAEQPTEMEGIVNDENAKPAADNVATAAGGKGSLSYLEILQARSADSSPILSDDDAC